MITQLFWHIHKLSFLLEKEADEALRTQLDIGFAQYKVLEAINQNALVQQNAVASLLDQTEASISRQVRILREKGLINAPNAMGSRRSRELSLTTVGEEMTRNASAVIESALEGLLGQLSFSEQQVLIEQSNRVVEKIKED